MLSRYRHIALRLGAVSLAISGTLVLGPEPARAGLTVTPSTDAEAMAKALIGPGVKLVPGSATYFGVTNPPYTFNDAAGFFSGDTSIFGNPAGASGVLLTTGSVGNALPPNNVPNKTQENQFPGDLPGDNYLSSLAGTNTEDSSILEFKITLDPGKVGIKWNYVFGSEEYNIPTEIQFNDVIAFTLDGTNLALVPSTSLPVNIKNVNNTTNSQFYRDNPVNSNNYATQYNGLTTVLTSRATGLRPEVEYTLRFAIADAADMSYDSGVFLLRGSIIGTTTPVPAPLPLVGAGAAFAWSRRLRSRIKQRVHSR